VICSKCACKCCRSSNSHEILTQVQLGQQSGHPKTLDKKFLEFAVAQIALPQFQIIQEKGSKCTVQPPGTERNSSVIPLLDTSKDSFVVHTSRNGSRAMSSWFLEMPKLQRPGNFLTGSLTTSFLDSPARKLSSRSLCKCGIFSRAFRMAPTLSTDDSLHLSKNISSRTRFLSVAKPWPKRM